MTLIAAVRSLPTHRDPPRAPDFRQWTVTKWAVAKDIWNHGLIPVEAKTIGYAWGYEYAPGAWAIRPGVPEQTVRGELAPNQKLIKFRAFHNERCETLYEPIS